jgi:general secretion pathway protein G
LKERHAGFSLVELVVVLAIMGVLASVALPLAEMSRKRAKEDELRLALREIRSALDAYKRAGDEGRIARAAGSSGYPPDLQTLAKGVPDARSPSRELVYFLRRVPADPFFAREATSAGEEGSPKPEATWGLRSYASPANAPKAGSDVFDVYSLSADKGLDGRPYREW